MPFGSSDEFLAPSQEAALHSVVRCLPFGTVEPVPDWDDTRAMSLRARPTSLIGTQV